MNINSFLDSLASNNSRNFKIEQLNAHSDNEVLRDVVRLALDPFTQFYQRKIPQYVTDKQQTSLENALGALYDLSSRTVTGVVTATVRTSPDATAVDASVPRIDSNPQVHSESLDNYPRPTSLKSIPYPLCMITPHLTQ